MRKEEVAQEHVFKVSLPEVRQTEHPTSSESPHPLPSTATGIHGHHRNQGSQKAWASSGDTFLIPPSEFLPQLLGFLISHYSFLEDAFSLFHQPP